MVKWPSVFDIGIPEIDKQHKRLVELINLAFYNIKNNSSKMDILVIFNELQDYVRFHLRYEESFMSQIGYPEFEDHKIFHDHFEDDIFNFQIEFDNNHELNKLRDSLVRFLMTWLVEHIVEEDKKYAKYYHNSYMGVFTKSN